MKIISRYLTRSILIGTGLLSVLFGGLQLFINFFNELGAITKTGYNVWQALLYSVLTLPGTVYALYPEVALLAALLVLGALASSHELTVIRTSGFSLFRLTGNLLSAALWIAMLALLIGEGIGPSLTALAKKHKAYVQSNGQMLETQSGIWMRYGHAFYHIGTNINNFYLKDITRYEVDDQYRLSKISYAESAQFINKKWEMSNVVSSNLQFEKITLKKEKHAIWDFNISLESTHLSLSNPNTMNLFQLYQQVHEREQNNINAANLKLNFWQRILRPFTTLIMIFLAIPFILGPLRSVSIGTRLVSGIIIGLSFFILNELISSLSLVYQIPPLFIVLTGQLIFILFGVILMVKKK